MYAGVPWVGDIVSASLAHTYLGRYSEASLVLDIINLLSVRWIRLASFIWQIQIYRVFWYSLFLFANKMFFLHYWQSQNNLRARKFTITVHTTWVWSWTNSVRKGQTGLQPNWLWQSSFSSVLVYPSLIYHHSCSCTAKDIIAGQPSLLCGCLFHLLSTLSLLQTIWLLLSLKDSHTASIKLSISSKKVLWKSSYISLVPYH